jgi:hypothetical protein
MRTLVHRRRTMDLTSEWATRIAREAAPDEAEDAPVLARAYLEGGQAREALFRSALERPKTKSIFGPETVATGVTVLPYVLEAIQHVGSELAGVLAAFGGTAAQAGAEVGAASGADVVTTGGSSDLSIVASNTTGAAYYVIGAIGTILTLSGRKERGQKKEELIEDKGIKEVHARLTEEISKVPTLDEDQADLITYRVLKVMLEDPSGAADFTRQVQKAT